MCLRILCFQSFLNFDHYHCRLEQISKNLSKIFAIAANYRLCLRVKTNQQTFFVLKMAFQKNLHLVSFINFSVDSAMNPIMMNVYIIILDVKPKSSAVSDHLLLCKTVLELKESLRIIRDRPSLNRNIKSAPLYLFGTV